MESAALRRINRAWNLAAYHLSNPLRRRIRNGNGRDEGLSVRMQRPQDNRISITQLDELPEIHYSNPVAYVP
jgi:hypothetical protein